jgi:hypothetical protein
VCLCFVDLTIAQQMFVLECLKKKLMQPMARSLR